MKTILESVRHFARRTPTAAALSHSGEVVTYQVLWDRVAALGVVLRNSGVRVLGLMADNSVDWVQVDLAAQYAGIATVPLPQFFTPTQISHAVSDCGADAVIGDGSVTERALGAPCAAVDLPATAMRLWRRIDRRRLVSLPAGTAKISYTSGTTGSPKGVCLSQASMDAVADSLVFATASLELRKHLCLLPLATLLENIAGVYAPLLSGAQTELAGLSDIGWSGAARLDMSRLCELLSHSRPNSIILVPEMLRMLLLAIDGGWSPPESLRFVAVGGGRVPVRLLEHAASSGLPVYEGYGLTECASVVALNTPDACRRGSVGRPLRHLNVSIRTDGEIVVGGHSILGYVGDDSSGRQSWATGDIGFLDQDGYLHVRGRKRNVFINSFGRNVSPDWIEPEFLRGSTIRQIAIFGEARPWNVAVVVPSTGATRTDIAAEIEALNSSLPDYARIGEFIVAVEAFTPENGLLTLNGRVRRDAVLRTYEQQIRDRYDDCVRQRA